MKLIKLGTPVHDCQALALSFQWDLENHLTKPVVVRVGTILECDCGKRLILVDDQRDEAVWIRHQDVETMKANPGRTTR